MHRCICDSSVVTRSSVVIGNQALRGLVFVSAVRCVRRSSVDAYG